MRRTFDPFRLLVVSIAGWLNRQQRDAIDYLREENRVLREQLGDKRLRLSDDQRRRWQPGRKCSGVAFFGKSRQSSRLKASRPGAGS